MLSATGLSCSPWNLACSPHPSCSQILTPPCTCISGTQSVLPTLCPDLVPQRHRGRTSVRTRGAQVGAILQRLEQPGSGKRVGSVSREVALSNWQSQATWLSCTSRSTSQTCWVGSRRQRWGSRKVWAHSLPLAFPLLVWAPHQESLAPARWDNFLLFMCCAPRALGVPSSPSFDQTPVFEKLSPSL